MKHFDSVKKLLVLFALVLGDFLSFAVSFELAFLSREYLSHIFLLPKFIVKGYLTDLYWLPLVFLFFFAIEGLYTKRMHFWYELRLLVKSIFIAFVVCLSIVSVGKLSDFVSRLFLFLLLFYGLIVFPLIRFSIKNLLFHLKLWRENIIIIGTSPISTKFAQSFDNNKYLGFKVLGFLSDTQDNNSNMKVIGPIDHARKVVQRLNITSCVLDENSLGEDREALIVKELQAYIENIIVIPKMRFLLFLNSEINYLFLEKLFILNVKNNLKSYLNRFLKRTFDLILSLILLPFLVVVMIILAIIVKLDSKGPVFYVSKRLGQKGKLFSFLKFRTMYVNNDQLLQKYLSSNTKAADEWERFRKLKDYDPRVTKFGRFLRKTSLDELPQILNIILGDMSFVGPRPYLESELERIGNSFSTIALTKPGITGLWQVSGRNELDFETRVDLDCFYVTNWSLWFDMIILLKTAQVVIKQKGAY